MFSLYKFPPRGGSRHPQAAGITLNGDNAAESIVKKPKSMNSGWDIARPRLLMFFRYSSGYINHWENRKNECLQHGHEDMKQHKYDGKKKRQNEKDFPDRI